MATITARPFVRHLSTTPTMHVTHLRRGETRHTGTGQTFWFRPLDAAISEVPLDDRELSVVVALRTADLQQLSAPTTATYRIVDPELAARRVDFSIDLWTGAWAEQPLDAIAAPLHGATTAAVVHLLQPRTLDSALRADLAELGMKITAAANEQLGFVHPENAGWDHISFCLFAGPVSRDGRELTSSAAVAGVPDNATRLSRTSTTANPAHTASSSTQPRRPASPRTGRARIPVTASSPSASPASFIGPACSPKSRNAAASESSSDRRWAMSVRTMPACRTDAASTRNSVGSTSARASSSIHGAPGWRSAAGGGCSSQAHSSAAAR